MVNYNEVNYFDGMILEKYEYNIWVHQSYTLTLGVLSFINI